MRRFRFVLVLFALSLAGQAGASKSIEEKIVGFVDAHDHEAVALLQRTVDMNSGTMNLDGVRAVGDVFRNEFDALGFETEWIDGSPFERAGHLVATHGDRGPHVLMIGHLDTVFEPDSPFQRYEPIDERYVKGPGTTDMKGGNIVVLHALRALDAVGVLDDLTVTVMLLGDEERSGKPTSVSRARLIEAADAADVALGFEDGDSDPTTAVVARRSSTSWKLEITGRPAHSSQIFGEGYGYGAVFEAARILNAMREALAGEEFLTFNPGLILGGTDVTHDPFAARGEAFGKNNVIAESVTVTGDLRCLSFEQQERAREHMRAIVADNLDETSATITFGDGYPPLDRSDGNLRLLSMWDAVSRDLGFGPVEPVDPRNAGAADISFTAGRVDMAMDGLGLMGSGGHTVEETADLTTLPMNTKRTAVLLWRLSRGE